MLPTFNLKKFFLIAGPCVIENENITFRTAEALCKITQKLRVPLIFKSSYDKANRLSVKSFRGIGIQKGLKILAQVREKFGVPVLTDVHSPEEAVTAAEFIDILQIPALLCRQTDLVLTAAKTGRTVNVKKGQFMAPWDMKNIVEKIESTGNKNIILTERGTTFGYNNLVADMRSIVVMKEFGYPVVFDATHSIQLPGGKGASSGGERKMAPVLAKAAVAAGADGVFFEVHPAPDKAPCDGSTMIALKDLPDILKTLLKIYSL
ncbi:MAG: 3-deoxy-8-phosphooctulonate synthase [Planctomycetes bacterium]|nr:3-deoxy-8-phosphooctulonate synthase [Planctomycetota bacterium]